MKIRIQYSSSQGPHLVEFGIKEIQQMLEEKTLIISQNIHTGETKTLVFEGNRSELAALGKALTELADKENL